MSDESDEDEPQMLPRPILIASLGNPAKNKAYANTFHSAGHTLLESVRDTLDYPDWSRDKGYANGYISRGPDYTLWQSPSLMNVSGGAVSKAWKAFLNDQKSPEEGERAKLVVIHDELESPLGTIKFKVGGSAKGHNGVKSCISSLGDKAFTRVGVGIGRPDTREKGAVTAYVLRKMKHMEQQKITAGAGEVIQHLAGIAEG